MKKINYCHKIKLFPIVMPAKAGIQVFIRALLDASFRWHDNRKKIIIIFFMTFSFLGSVSFAAQNSLDKIVAIVNEDVITASELNTNLSMVKAQAIQQQVSVPSESALKKKVLDQLIVKKLQLQLAKQGNIAATETELDQAIERIAKQNQISVSSLYEQLDREGMAKTTYRNEIREQLTLHKLQQQEVVSRISVSPKDLENFKKSKVWVSNEPKEYRLIDILIPLSEEPSNPEVATAQKLATDAINKLQQGLSLAKLEQEKDFATLSQNDLGWLRIAEVPTAFISKVSSMQEKEFAGPIRAGNGFHILHLSAIRSAGGKQAMPTKKQMEELLFQTKFEEALKNWVSRLRHQAYIVINSA